MTPPPTNIDGTDITGATIDGQEVQEITIDGQTVFSAGPDTPDGVVMQYFANTYAQGDSTWVDDATSDGSQDMTLTGDLQSATLSDGSESISSDGVDDFGAMTMPPELEGSSLTSFSVEYAIEHTSTGEGVVFACNNSSDPMKMEMFLNFDEVFNGQNGNFMLQFRDIDNGFLRASPSTNPNIDDGNRHDISIVVNDSTTNDVDIIIDGTSVAVSIDNDNSPSNFSTWDFDMNVFARNDGGSTDNFTNLQLGAMRWFDTNITSQTIGDYP